MKRKATSRREEEKYVGWEWRSAKWSQSKRIKHGIPACPVVAAVVTHADWIVFAL